MSRIVRNRHPNQRFLHEDDDFKSQTGDYDRRLDINLYVTGLPPEITETALGNLFKSHGKVTRVKLLPIKTNEFSTRAGFVCFATEKEADNATAQLDGISLGKYTIHVRYSKSQAVKSASSKPKNEYEELLSRLEVGPPSDRDVAMMKKSSKGNPDTFTKSNESRNRCCSVDRLDSSQQGFGNQREFVDRPRRDNFLRCYKAKPFNNGGSITDVESNDRHDNQFSSRGTSRLPRNTFQNGPLSKNFINTPAQKPVRREANNKMSPQENLEIKSKVPGKFSHSPCRICGKMTQSHCGVCSSVHYCSQACQRKDWPEHSKVCSELSAKSQNKENSCLAEKADIGQNKTKKVPSSESFARPPAQKRTPKILLIPPAVKGESSFDVLVTDVDVENAILVCQIADEKLIAALNELQADLNSHFESTEPSVLVRPAVGDACATKFSEDGMWYRAVVKKLCDGGKVLVQFVDYGNKEMVQRNELMQIDIEFCRAPAYSLMCKLAQTDLKSWTPVIEKLGEVLQKSDMLLHAQYYKEVDGVVYVYLMAGEDVCLNEVVNEELQRGSTNSAGLAEPEVTPSYSTRSPPLDLQAEHPNTLPLAEASEVNAPVISEPKKALVAQSPTFSEDQVIKSEASNEVNHVAQLSEVYKSGDIIAIDIPDGELDILVSFVEDPNSFYCQIVGEDLLSLQNYLQSLTKHCQSHNDSKKYNFKIGDLCCAVFAEDQLWYRAEVLDQSSSDLYEVRYFDFGNSAHVPAEQMQLLPKEYLNLPIQAFKASLANCFPKKGNHWDDDVVKAFKDSLPLMSMLKAEVVSKDTQGIIQLLVFVGENETLNQQLYDQKLAFKELTSPDKNVASKPEKSAQLTRRTKAVKEDFQSPKNFEHHPLKTENKVATSGEDEAVVLDNTTILESRSEILKLYEVGMNQKVKISITCSNEPGLFHCHVVDHQQLGLLVESISELTLYGMKDPEKLLEDFCEGVYCAAYFEEEHTWYRAVIIKLDGDAVFIKYIDYGNEAQLSKQEIRVLPEQFRKLPVMAISCTLANMKPVSGSGWGNDFAKLIDSFIGKELNAMFIKQSDFTYSVIVPDLVNMMISQGIGLFCL